MYTVKPTDIADRLSEDKEHLYLVDTSTMDSIKTLSSPFRTEQKKYYSNLYTLGGWATALPLKKEIIDSYDLQNPLKDADTKDDVYFVDQNNFMIKYNYIREHYYPDLVYVMMKDLGISQVYKIYHVVDLKIPNDLKNIDSRHIHFKNFKHERDDKGLHLSGELYIDGLDTFDQEIFIKAKSINNGNEKTYEATTYIGDAMTGTDIMAKNILRNFKLDIPYNEINGNQIEFQIVLKSHSDYYNIKTIKLTS